MGRSARTALILWFATALSIVGFVAAFNITVDPFGYFGNNTLGYYFSSERQFKYSLVKSYDYNAIVLGDSRVAYTGTNQIDLPGYKFVNGGVAGSSLAEQIGLLRASRLSQLKLAVFGLRFDDLAKCSKDDEPKRVESPRELGSWDALRFAASLTQFAYSIDALSAGAQGLSPQYHADGTRSVVSKLFQESALIGKTAHYWSKIEREIPKPPSKDPRFEFDVKCRKLLGAARGLADRYGFSLVVVFLPMNSDLLQHLHWDRPQARSQIRKFLAHIQEVVPHVVDLSNSSFSDSNNFWLNDSMHFKPATGARLIEEAINQSLGAHASK
jgi:hypothetical protein